ncbi:YggS family pyridoxal phosphate-dependent enzyme [Brevibacillus centrosporus]|uniref:YggS family pyridoxal phosphate-dependent enzyme n=1 Tax=Brevibacillus centrosporus TaxID=54910 RepID=UPI002E1EE2E0|nr:YggS family pyridoxal phosphate-dependent enzyme [Brevibacillus centrosporus]MED1951573.1 YggS family pyridoxal phosphate-dependent enzyme [Brevibacillus centrosporus]
MSMDMELLKQRMQSIEERIQAACDRANRKREEVKIIAVTKYVDAEAIRDLLDAGIEHIGENRVQDGVPKYEQYGDRGTWHFIGHLQTNKAKEVVGRFPYIHSLDRLSLAEELNKRGEALNQVVFCFLQLNISGEETKFGLSPNDVLAFLRETSNMRHIKIIGLMTMAPVVENTEDARPVFRGLYEWKDRINEWAFPHAHVEELSMGMSSDFEVAIEEGATYIRLGSVLVKP